MNFRGKTVAEAIANALRELGVREDELEIKVVQEPTKGILGIGQKEATIEVTYKETSFADILNMDLETPVRAEEVEAPEPEEAAAPVEQPAREPRAEKPARQPKAPESDEARQRKIEKATAFLKDIIGKLGYQVEYFIREDQGFVIINIRGRSAGKLIGKRGETLYALQYLVNIVANRNDDNNTKFLVDIEDFRQQRERTLSNLAVKLARQVKASGESVSLEPMNPLERKIIHMALQKDPEIATSSEGEEGQRHIVISLKAQE